MDVSDLSVGSELVNGISDLGVLSVMEEILKHLEDGATLIEVHSFSELLDLVELSPFSECISEISLQVLEKLNESLFFDLVVNRVEEGIISN